MLIPGMSRVNPRVVSYKARDIEQAYTLTRACLALAGSVV
jgi:D-aminopeptidase